MDGITGLIGVIVGFMLGEGRRWIHHKRRVTRLKELVEKELESLLIQIPAKKKIIQDIIAGLPKGEILEGRSVGIINTGYKQHITELYEHLNDDQRYCLHVIHERLNVGDEKLTSFEHDYKFDLLTKVLDNPIEAYTGLLQDLLKCYEGVEYLINEYLEGKPEAVFKRKPKSKGPSGGDVAPSK